MVRVPLQPHVPLLPPTGAPGVLEDPKGLPVARAVAHNGHERIGAVRNQILARPAVDALLVAAELGSSRVDLDRDRLLRHEPLHVALVRPAGLGDAGDEDSAHGLQARRDARKEWRGVRWKHGKGGTTAARSHTGYLRSSMSTHQGCLAPYAKTPTSSSDPHP